MWKKLKVPRVTKAMRPRCSCFCGCGWETLLQKMGPNNQGHPPFCWLQTLGLCTERLSLSGRGLIQSSHRISATHGLGGKMALLFLGRSVPSVNDTGLGDSWRSWERTVIWQVRPAYSALVVDGGTAALLSLPGTRGSSTQLASFSLTLHTQKAQQNVE